MADGDLLKGPPGAAAAHYARGEELAQTLPVDIQEVLKRKSSRDPNSRFARKLHALLSYVEATDPKLVDEFGIGWIDDQVFRIFKPRLLGVMGIKLNTLNVNLRDLGFIQLQGDQRLPGWTIWRKDGFTKRTYQLPRMAPGMVQLPDNDVFNPHLRPFPVADRPIEVGHVSPQQIDELHRMVAQEWTELVGSDHDLVCAASYVVGRAATRYKQPKQPQQNAFDVLRAILAPQDKMEITFPDFFRFMAMFGPADTVMLKIHSLLEVATAGNPWLYFGITPGIEETGMYAYFDEAEPNALVIHDGKGNEKVWNLPLVSARDDFHYIEDKDGRKYGSWIEYFREHPPGETQNFDVSEITPFH